MLISQKNQKQPNSTGLHSYFNEERERQIDTLAYAICRFIDWRKRQLDMKEERKLKAMLTRLRNRKRGSSQ
jgi:hypothetical protein